MLMLAQSSWIIVVFMFRSFAGDLLHRRGVDCSWALALLAWGSILRGRRFR